MFKHAHCRRSDTFDPLSLATTAITSTRGYSNLSIPGPISYCLLDERLLLCCFLSGLICFSTFFFLLNRVHRSFPSPAFVFFSFWKYPIHGGRNNLGGTNTYTAFGGIILFFILLILAGGCHLLKIDLANWENIGLPIQSLLFSSFHSPFLRGMYIPFSRLGLLVHMAPMLGDGRARLWLSLLGERERQTVHIAAVYVSASKRERQQNKRSFRLNHS
jgi:hypothetical protein